MKSYVVSMPEAELRRKHISAEFLRHDLKHKFFNALNGEEALICARNWEVEIDNNVLTPAELGCMMSHVSLWKKLIDSNLKYLAIFEDDVILSEDVKHFLTTDTWIPSNTDLIKLETMYNLVDLTETNIVVKRRKLQKLESDHWGAAGYIISQQGAKKLLSLLQAEQVQIAIDHFMFDTFRKQTNACIYQVFPAVCIQDKVLNEHAIRFESSIEPERIYKRKRLKVKLSLKQKVYREVKRPFLQINPYRLFQKYKEYVDKKGKVQVPFL